MGADEGGEDLIDLDREEATLVYGMLYQAMRTVPEPEMIRQLSEAHAGLGLKTFEARELALHTIALLKDISHRLAQFIGPKVLSQFERGESKMMEAGLDPFESGL